VDARGKPRLAGRSFLGFLHGPEKARELPIRRPGHRDLRRYKPHYPTLQPWSAEKSAIRVVPGQADPDNSAADAVSHRIRVSFTQAVGILIGVYDHQAGPVLVSPGYSKARNTRRAGIEE